LQESLDFEQNQELSQNLYSLYEFMRVSILNYREKPYDISTSRDITSELLASWAELASDG
jgi:flagellin-specific chaperone FliS